MFFVVGKAMHFLMSFLESWMLFESLMQCLSYQAIIWWNLNFQIFIIFCTHRVILHNILSLQMALHGAYEVHGNVEMKQCIM